MDGEKKGKGRSEKTPENGIQRRVSTKASAQAGGKKLKKAVRNRK